MATRITGTVEDDVSLRLVRTIGAPAQKVFAAWLDPGLAAQWFAPGDMSASASIEARVGGRYRVEMKNPDGSTHIVGGEYREIVPNLRIVKTWQWEGSPTLTELTVDFREKTPGVTELTLTHTRFRDAEMRDKHSHGWEGCLVKLEKLFT